MSQHNVEVLFTAMLVIIAVLFFATGSEAESRFVCCVPKGEWLWVRDMPSKEGNKIGTIRYGYEMQVTEIQNQYAHVILHDGKTGWVDVAYIEMPIKEEIWTINTKEPLNKRETPDGRFLTKIKGGSRISVLAWRYSPSGELWAKTFHGGYVKAKYLTK